MKTRQLGNLIYSFVNLRERIAIIQCKSLKCFWIVDCKRSFCELSQIQTSFTWHAKLRDSKCSQDSLDFLSHIYRQCENSAFRGNCITFGLRFAHNVGSWTERITRLLIKSEGNFQQYLKVTIKKKLLEVLSKDHVHITLQQWSQANCETAPIYLKAFLATKVKLTPLTQYHLNGRLARKSVQVL